jgi:hypothetical protein
MATPALGSITSICGQTPQHSWSTDTSQSKLKMSSVSNSLIPPEPQIFVLPEGDVEIHVGTEKGWVTSFHLIDTKAKQLQQAYIKNVS